MVGCAFVGVCVFVVCSGRSVELCGVVWVVCVELLLVFVDVVVFVPLVVVFLI